MKGREADRDFCNDDHQEYDEIKQEHIGIFEECSTTTEERDEKNKHSNHDYPHRKSSAKKNRNVLEFQVGNRAKSNDKQSQKHEESIDEVKESFERKGTAQ